MNDVNVNKHLDQYRPNAHSRAALGVLTSYIWHSTDVRAERPPFSVLPGK